MLSIPILTYELPLLTSILVSAPILMTPIGHPSARHSPFDWETESAQGFPSHPLLATTRSTEVVLSMGEMLYIPSYWFHYIVSQVGR